MIDKIDKFQDWVETIITASLGISFGYYLNTLESSKSFELVVIPVIVTIIMLEKSLILILSNIINHSISLRKKLLNNHFIEGYWIETIIDSKDPRIKYGFALVKISFANMRYRISGEVFNSDCSDSVATFNSYYSDYDNFSLKYFFRGINVMDNSDFEIVGNTEFMFIPGEGFPTRMKGKIIDNKNKGTLKVEGERIDPELLARYGVKDENSAKMIVLEYLQKGEEELGLRPGL